MARKPANSPNLTSLHKKYGLMVPFWDDSPASGGLEDSGQPFCQPLNNFYLNIYNRLINLYYFKMNRGCLLLAIILILSGVLANTPTCPAGNVQIFAGNQLLYADSVTISTSGNIRLQNGLDIQCYNYTLPSVFAKTPGVAIGNILFTQLSTIFKPQPVIIFSSQLRQYNQIASESYRSLSERSGAIPNGQK